MNKDRKIKNLGLLIFSVLPLKVLFHYFVYTSTSRSSNIPGKFKLFPVDQPLSYHIDNIFSDEVWLFIPVILFVLFIGWYFGLLNLNVNNESNLSESNDYSTNEFNSKEEIVNQYKRDNDLPDTLDTAPGGPKMFKRDMTGLMAYFKEMTNMERIFNEMTGAIRNGYTVKKYLKDANLMDDPEIREIAARGFNDVAGFLKDMLEINENPELRKDYDACMEAVKILKV